MIRDEALWALVPPGKRPGINAWIYGRDRRYRPGGEFFEAGLFDWERKIFAHASFPARGTILVGGAGAGRESTALGKLDFRVTAFEALPALSSSGNGILTADYEDFIAAADGRDGPLTETIRKESFDAVLFGWGSFSNVLDPGKRLALLKAARAIAPHAPLVLSFLAASTLPPGLIGRLRGNLRALFRALGCRHVAQEGDCFLSTAGFSHLFSPTELRELAESAGYRIVTGDFLPYPHALLDPRP
jgi:hypothetical protein